MPGVLDQAACAELVDEVAETPFEPLEAEVGPVRQRGEYVRVVLGEDAFPATDRLASALATATGETGFVPNEAVFRRHVAPLDGITPHRDNAFYVVLVAIFTLTGSAPFAIVRDREGTDVIDEWITRAGDLCLLRQPDFPGAEGERPLHRVGAPESERMTLTLRMNKLGAGRGWSSGT